MSALTSLLVRDDAVSVRQIEEALARQMVDGGELDTALLELGALPENKLIAYRAVSERGLPATREEVMTPSPSTLEQLPAELALAFQVSPLTFDGQTLTVAACRPLEPAQLSELSERTGLRIAVRISAELRVHAALERFYGLALPPRLAQLRGRVDAQPAGELVEVLPLLSSPRADRTEPLPAFEEADDFQAVLAAAFERASGSPVVAHAEDADRTRPLSAKRASAAQRKRARSSETERFGSAVFGAAPAPAPAARPAAAPAPAAKPNLPQRRAPANLPQGPLTAAAAKRALSEAQERDAVLELSFRFARQYFDATVLFMLKGGRALGAQAYNTAPLDVRELSMAIAKGSALDDLSRSLLPRVVDLSRKPEDRALAGAVKRIEAQPAALIPLCVKRRVVAFVYGDRAGEALHIDQLSELLELLPHVTSAFERIIRTRKALGVGSATSPDDRDLSHAPTQRSLRVPAARSPSFVPEARTASFSPEARTAEMDDGARQALESLKIPLAPSLPSGFGGSDDDDIYATARIPIQPLPLDQFDSPPRYFAKPPPGTGRYQSLAPKHGAHEILRQPSGARDQKADAQARGSTKRSRSEAPKPRVRKSLLPAAPEAVGARAGQATLPGAKPAPGSGAYHNQVGTTELISMPHARGQGEEAGGYKPASGAPVGPATRQEPRLEPGASAEGRAGRDEGAGAESGRPPRGPADLGAAASFENTQRAAQLIDELCRSEPGEDSAAVKALLALGEPALTQLLARFPGPLWFDRRKPHTRVPLGRDISPICRALDAFGEQAVGGLIPLLTSGSAEIRYYATLFAADRVDPVLLEALLARLFDDDPQIRLLVRDALPHYRRFDGFEKVTQQLCERARDDEAPLYMRLSAIDAISVLRDVGSVSTLIELIAHADRQISLPSHRALTLITCQDFGKAPRKWRSWHAANGARHRVEWLIEGLMHAEESTRTMAGLELQKLTQVYYGYVAAASRREREAAQKRYLEWWRSEGRARLYP